MADLTPDIAIYTFKVMHLPGRLPQHGFTVGKGPGTIWVPLSQVNDPDWPGSFFIQGPKARHTSKHRRSIELDLNLI